MYILGHWWMSWKSCGAMVLIQGIVWRILCSNFVQLFFGQWTIFQLVVIFSGWSGQGYKACPTCNEDTSSVRVIGKTSYVGHKRFLHSNHRMRRDIQFDGQIERRHPPRRFTCDEILEQVNRLVPEIPGKHESFGGVKRRQVAEDQNWRKKSIFYELDYW